MINHNNSELQMERIVFFSDAVFAIAITLLIIEIKVPHLERDAPDREFWLALLNLIPSLGGYFFSFFVIGAYWIGHHRIYGHIVRWNYGLIWRNVFFLMTIAFMPFPTAFFSEYVRLVPLVLYAVTFGAAGLLELWLWRYAVGKGLVDDALSPSVISQLSWRMTSLPIVGAAAILIGVFISPIFSGWAFLTLPIVQRIIRARFRDETDKVEVIENDFTREN